MSRPMDDLPERLLASDATDFERRVLEAALQKQALAGRVGPDGQGAGRDRGRRGDRDRASTLAADAAVAKATAAVGNDVAVAVGFGRRDRTGRCRRGRRHARRPPRDARHILSLLP